LQEFVEEPKKTLYGNGVKAAEEWKEKGLKRRRPIALVPGSLQFREIYR
jgi:hypothetical protein